VQEEVENKVVQAGPKEDFNGNTSVILILNVSSSGVKYITANATAHYRSVLLKGY
jgi:hypothetical protein